MNAHFPHASRLIYGCMGLGGGWNDKPATKADISQARSIIDTVLSLDINVFDHADIYTFGNAETVAPPALTGNHSLKTHAPAGPAADDRQIAALAQTPGVAHPQFRIDFTIVGQIERYMPAAHKQGMLRQLAEELRAGPFLLGRRKCPPRGTQFFA